METQNHNGYEISFEEKNEVWKTKIKLENDIEENLEDASLKGLKKKIDLFCKKKFERMPVFVRTKVYRMGGGRDKSYLRQYTEATITSVSPDGNIYTVVKGEKHSAKNSISRYNSQSVIVLDTVVNRELIEKIEAAGKAEWKAKVEQNKLIELLNRLDEAKLYRSVYGKDLYS
tara:strand:- start:456 stop:974 length:519 start_codon:yes stop_codon:yes gene_type:complete